jgi:hypothetical protein
VSSRALDLKRSGRILWQYRILLGACALLGLLANAAHAYLQPATYSSYALVVLSPTVDLDTQAVVVDSTPVVVDALGRARLGVSVADLQSHVEAMAAGSQTLEIVADGPSASWVKQAVNAVTNAYVGYIRSDDNPGGPQPAQVFHFATTPTIKPLETRLAEAALLGLLAGLTVGLVAALALGRNDRRLRTRDAIADAIGVPVIASLAVPVPSDAAGWARFLGQQEVPGTDAWRLRTVLRELGVTGTGLHGARPEGCSVTMLSIATDKAALGVGPRFAAFAASEGVPATLVIGPQQEAAGTPAAVVAANGGKAPPLTEALVLNATAAALGTALKGIGALRSGAEAAGVANLRVSGRESRARLEAQPGTLAVAVGVVDGTVPRVTETTRADVTLLAVTAGAATSEQLVRVAASAAADGRPIWGILVANAAAGDETTGRVPELARPQENRMPARFRGVVTTESR